MEQSCHQQYIELEVHINRRQANIDALWQHKANMAAPRKKEDTAAGCRTLFSIKVEIT